MVKKGIGKKRKKIQLFVEGTKNKENGDLRIAFSKFLNNAGVPMGFLQVRMSGDKARTIKDFKNNEADQKSILIDLDAPPDEREKDIFNSGLEKFQEDSFYMIQQMEAWFLSQPEIIQEYYKIENINKHGSPQNIHNPCRELKRIVEQKTSSAGITKRNKKTYHKVKNGSELLEKLDPAKLQDDFDDFKNLVNELKKKIE